MQRFRFIGVALTVLVIGVIVFALVLGADTVLKRTSTPQVTPTNILILVPTLSNEEKLTLTAFASNTPPTLSNTPIPSIVPTASNQSITVNTLSDIGDGTCDIKECTLREALMNASWGSIIDFASDLEGTITLKDVLSITKDVSINGSKTKTITISGEGQFRIFYVEEVSVTLRDLTLTNAGDGAIYNNSGTLHVENCGFIKNKSRNGGGIFNVKGTITIFASRFLSNEAQFGGGIDNFEGSITIANSSFVNNSAGSNGAIGNNGNIDIVNSTFFSNHSNFIDTLANNGELRLKNSIIVNKSLNKNCGGNELMDQGNNLQFPADDCGDSIPVRDPLFANLTNTGMLPLLASSPAIDAGDNSICMSPPVNNRDQTGSLRIGNPSENKVCDIGAVEYSTNSSSIDSKE